MPSMNHSGGFTLISVCTPAPIRPRLNTSYWNWWTISWPITCSSSSYAPVNGRTIRCLKNSVTPPVPSPMSPPMALVCWKSECDAYSRIGLRPWNSWWSTRERRPYQRSAMRAASSAAARSAG